MGSLALAVAEGFRGVFGETVEQPEVLLDLAVGDRELVVVDGVQERIQVQVGLSRPPEHAHGVGVGVAVLLALLRGVQRPGSPAADGLWFLV